MYSKLTEYMNNYDGRERSGGERKRERERNTGRWKSAESSILLIRSIYRRHVAAFTFTSPRFSESASFSRDPRVLGSHSFLPRPDIIRDVNARRVHHVLSFTCARRFSSLSFSSSSPPPDFSFLSLPRSRGFHRVTWWRLLMILLITVKFNLKN